MASLLRLASMGRLISIRLRLNYEAWKKVSRLGEVHQEDM
jgi:hypothetical protein